MCGLWEQRRMGNGNREEKEMTVSGKGKIYITSIMKRGKLNGGERGRKGGGGKSEEGVIRKGEAPPPQGNCH